MDIIPERGSVIRKALADLEKHQLIVVTDEQGDLFPECRLIHFYQCWFDTAYKWKPTDGQCRRAFAPLFNTSEKAVLRDWGDVKTRYKAVFGIRNGEAYPRWKKVLMEIRDDPDIIALHKQDD